MGACTAERECIRLTQTWLRFALTASLPMVGTCPTSSALPPVHRNWHRLHPRNPDSNSPWCTFVSSPTSAVSPPIQCTLSWIYAPEPAVGHKVPFAAIRMYNDKKHHRNCEYCPGQYLIVNHHSSMSWFKFCNLSVIVDCITKSLIH